MLGWIIQTSIMSFILIYIIHQLFLYFKETLTTPKIKDFVNLPNTKYQHILDTISKNDNMTSSSSSSTSISSLPSTSEIVSDSATMKNELKSFLKGQLRPN